MKIFTYPNPIFEEEKKCLSRKKNCQHERKPTLFLNGFNKKPLSTTLKKKGF